MWSWPAFTSSLSLVAVSEMGDKTQLLAFALAARFRKPWVVLAGILVATLLNHALASQLGSWLSQWSGERLSSQTWGIGLGLVYIVFGFWMMIPDRDENTNSSHRFGPFLTTAFLFFFAEMGDKTQLATVALGASFPVATGAVLLGSTAGMVVSDGLAVFAGDRWAGRIPMARIRSLAAVVFILFGVVTAWRAWS